jgi:hypothetical protein
VAVFKPRPLYFQKATMMPSEQKAILDGFEGKNIYLLYAV